MNHWQQFTEWWAELEPRLLAVARRYGTSREDSLDIVQDLAVLAIQNHQRFTEKEAFRRWAFARLHWLSLDRRRLAVRDTDLSEAHIPAVDARQDNKVLVQEVVDLIERLPTRQREVVMMTMQGHSPAAIAEKMKITPATIRSLLRYGRNHLAALLAKKELGR